MKKLIVTAIAAVVLLGGLAAAQSSHDYGLDPRKSFSQFVHTTWSIEDGLSQNTVDVITQTRDGYIWIGTFGGLSRFDGVRFENFNRANTPAMHHNHVSALMEDEDGNLWIGTNGGGLLRYRNGNFESFGTEAGLANNYIRSLLSLGHGSFIVAMERGGLAQYDPAWKDPAKKFAPMENTAAIGDNNIRAILIDRERNLWIATGSNLAKLSGDGIRVFKKADGLADNSIQCLAMDSTGTIWIGAENGLVRYDRGVFNSFELKDGLGSLSIRSLMVDRRGNLWVGTDGGGISFLHIEEGATRFKTYLRTQGLSNEFVRAIMEDREGSLWIGSRSGVHKVHDGKFSTLTTADGISDDFVRTVMEDSKGRMWIGTNGGGVNVLQNGSFSTYAVHDGLLNGFIRGFLEEPDGTIWIATDGGGISRTDGRGSKFTFKNYTIRDGLAENYIRCMVRGADGSIWIGTYGGGVSRYAGGRFTTYSTRDGLSHNFVFTMLVARDSAVWIGTNGGGISRWKNGTFKTYSSKDGLAGDFVFTLLEDREGTIWAGTNGFGISRFDGAAFTSFSTADGLFDDVILSMLEDDNGFFWLGGNRGVFKVSKEDIRRYERRELKKIPFVEFGKRDGLKTGEVSGVAQPASWKGRDGRLWFPTLKGLAVIDPNRMQINRLMPPVVIEGVVADSTEFAAGSRVELAPGTRKIEFHYTALSFVAPEKVRFRYRLEGYDDWVDAGSRRTAYYTNIPPGDYVFRVMASNNDGIWNEAGASYEFSITPFYYQRTSFYVLLVIALLVVAAGLYAVRVRYLHARARDLERVVEERTHALVAEKDRAEGALRETERAREDLAVANTALDQANKDKTDLLSIVAHDLKNKLVAIRTIAHSLKSEQNDEATIRDWYDALFDSANHMLALIKDVLDSAAIEMGHIHLNRRRVDLSRTVELVILTLRDQANRKGQNIVLQSVDRGVCVVNADDRWMKDAMENILSNAIKFSPPDTSVVIRLRRVGPSVRYEVEDQGPGITDADRELLFGKFQRLSAKPTAGEVSTGLGLAIVKRAVEMHQGTVSVTRGENGGAVFVIELPAYEGLTPAAQD